MLTKYGSIDSDFLRDRQTYIGIKFLLKKEVFVRSLKSLLFSKGISYTIRKQFGSQKYL